jgi:DNA-binding response OmpR family regulator
MAEKGDDRMTGDTILLVDADPEIEEKIVSILESEGYIVFASAGSKVNAEMADKFRPALIFLRPLSPNAAGFAVCRTIHTIETLRDVPIVILASLKGPIDRRFTDYYGIVDFLKLTFTPEELIEKTAALVRDRQDEESPPAAEQTTPVEEEVRTEQEVSYVGDETDHVEETSQIALAEDKKEPERFKEEWHAGDEEKVTKNDRPAWGDRKYTARQYDRQRSKSRGIKKSSVFIGVALMAIIAAGLVLYLGNMPFEDQVREARRLPKPQKQQEVTGNRSDAPSPQPSSLPPAPAQAPESTPVPPATTFYAAQIGAFKTEDIADALAQKFRLQGYEAYVQRGTAKDSSVVYRVLVGRVEKRKEAVTLAGEVGAKEKIKTTVFQGE